MSSEEDMKVTRAQGQQPFINERGLLWLRVWRNSQRTFSVPRSSFLSSVPSLSQIRVYVFLTLSLLGSS